MTSLVDRFRHKNWLHGCSRLLRPLLLNLLRNRRHPSWICGRVCFSLRRLPRQHRHRPYWVMHYNKFFSSNVSHSFSNNANRNLLHSVKPTLHALGMSLLRSVSLI